MAIGAILRPFIRQAGRYVYDTLRAQDRIIDYTYRKTGLYNRGIVRGLKHGLAGGAIAGGTFNLGLPGLDDNAIPQKRKQPYGRKFQKAYSRRQFGNRRNNKYCVPKYNRRRRYVYTRRY